MIFAAAAGGALSAWEFLAGVAAFVGLVWFVSLTLAGPSRGPTLRVLAPPYGDEPEDVREAWVGLILPIAAASSSDPRGPAVLRLPGEAPASPDAYEVDAHAALDVLEKFAPDAAEWYRKHDPRAGAAGGRFVFRAASVEPLAPHQLAPGEVVGAEIYDAGKNKRCGRCGLIMPIREPTCERCGGVFVERADHGPDERFD